jgi:hypothetical protein
MKQKFNTGRKNKKTVKKVLVGVGAGLLVLAAASGVAYGLNTHYNWVELPAWMNPPVEEVVEVDHAVVIMSNEQAIYEFAGGAFTEYKPFVNSVPGLDEGVTLTTTSELTKIHFDADDVGYLTITFYADPVLLSGSSLPYELENGFIYDFSEFTVVEGEALVPVITAIA